MPSAAELTVDVYASLQKEAVARHGERTLVLLQMGAFYEVYDDVREDSPQIGVCVNILYLNPVRHANETRAWYQCGFKKEYFDRYRRMLMERRYTVVLADQDEDDARVRRLTQTLSPGFDPDASESVVAVALVADGSAVHVARLDTLINRTELFRVESGGDPNCLMGRLRRALVERGPCHEIEVHRDGPSTECSAFDDEAALATAFPGAAIRLVDRRPLGRKGRFVYDRRWQVLSLETHMGRHAGVGDDVLGKLGLRDETPEGLAAYVLLLALASAHDPEIVAGLHPPHTSEGGRGDGALRLLDGTARAVELFESEHMSVLSLFKQHVRTSMGRRSLRERLRRPSAVPARISEWIDESAAMRDTLERGQLKGWSRLLSSMGDVDRLAARLAAKRLRPSEMPTLLRSLDAARDVLVETPPFIQAGTRGADFATVGLALPRLLGSIGSLFEAETAHDGVAGLFARACDDPRLRNLEEARASVVAVDAEIASIGKTIDALIGKAGCVNVVNSMAGYAMLITKHRAAQVEKAMPSRFAFVAHNKTSQARFDDAVSLELMRRYGETRACVELEADRLFRATLTEMNDLFFREAGAALGRVIGHLDMLHGAARHAMQSGYELPTLDTQMWGEPAGVHAVDMRHPVVETLVVKSGRAFRSNTVHLDAERCMLLYGVNSAGKSSLLKGMAINVVLAQCGLFVACRSMTLRPFRTLALHIGGRDDIFRAQSTFVKEIEEINVVLRIAARDGTGLLFLADELGNSTEDESAVRIVASLLHVLLGRRSTVLLATHMFALQSNTFVRSLPALSNWHMRVDFEGDQGVVFERELRPGLPSERSYGVRIASRLLAEHTSMLTALRSGMHAPPPPLEASASVSRYDRRVVAMRCTFCDYRPTKPTDRPLEIHHIEEQRTAVAGFVPSGKRVHDPSNQVATCMFCHDEIDRGNIVVRGYVDTIDGRRLDWERRIPAEDEPI